MTTAHQIDSFRKACAADGSAYSDPEIIDGICSAIADGYMTYDDRTGMLTLTEKGIEHKRRLGN